MLEAIGGFLLMKQILEVLFRALSVNKQVVEILFVAIIAVGILLVACTKKKNVGTIIFVGDVCAYVIICQLLPYAATVATWGGVLTAAVMVIVVKTMTYRMMHKSTYPFRWWQKLLIYMA